MSLEFYVITARKNTTPPFTEGILKMDRHRFNAFLKVVGKDVDVWIRKHWLDNWEKFNAVR